jgi:hypothetical protein
MASPVLLRWRMQNPVSRQAAAAIGVAVPLVTARPSAQQRDSQPPAPSVSCASKPGERTRCDADTSHGVALQRTYDGTCLLTERPQSQLGVIESLITGQEFAHGPRRVLAWEQANLP